MTGTILITFFFLWNLVGVAIAAIPAGFIYVIQLGFGWIQEKIWGPRESSQS